MLPLPKRTTRSVRSHEVDKALMWCTGKITAILAQMAYPCDVSSQRGAPLAHGTGPDQGCRYNSGDRRPVGTPGRDLTLAVITRVASRRWTYRGG